MIINEPRAKVTLTLPKPEPMCMYCSLWQGLDQPPSSIAIMTTSHSLAKCKVVLGRAERTSNWH